MKTYIWNCVEPFPSRVNFVDSNNVLLGYALAASCCEDAGWTISAALDGSAPELTGDEHRSFECCLDDYVFDPDFCTMEKDGSAYEERNTAIFKLVSPWPGKPPLYLRLMNKHNGYYSHGFTFRGAETIKGNL